MKNIKTQSLAQSLYFSGHKIKDIAQQLETSEKTIRNWAKKDHWKAKRAAQQISRDNIVQNLLLKIDELSNKDTLNADKIIKLAHAIDKIQRQGNIVDYMHTFLAFIEWLKEYQKKNKDISKEFVLQLITLQDTFVNEKLKVASV